MKYAMLIGLTAAIFNSVAMASSVTAGTDTTEFSSETPALASEVNANFAALIAAINDNDDRITALEEASGEVASLEEMISGATYTVLYFGNIIGVYDDAQPGNFAYLEGFGGKSILTFHEGGSMTENFQGESKREIPMDAGCVYDEGLQQDVCSVVPDDETYGSEEIPGGSWSLTGNTLFVTFEGEGEPEEFTVTTDGNLLVLVSSDLFQDGSNSDYEHSVAIGIRSAQP